MTSNSDLTPNAAGRRARRNRVTSKRVHLVDSVTSVVINVGGVGVIATVLGILVYLVAVVLPLFSGARISPSSLAVLDGVGDPKQFLMAEIDEYRSMLAVVRDDGEVLFLDAASGRVLQRKSLFAGLPDGVKVTSFSRPVDGSSVAFGFSDGTVGMGSVEFVTDFLDEATVAPELRALEKGTRTQFEDGVVEHVPTGEWRRVRGSAELDPPLPMAETPAAVTLLQYRPTDDGSRLAAFLADGTLVVNEVAERENLMTGETIREIASHVVPVPAELLTSTPQRMLFTSKGDQLYLAWEDGRVARFDLRDMDASFLAETLDVTPAGAKLTALRFMYGEQSVLSGDSNGDVRGWFKLARADAKTADGAHMVEAHRFSK
ncbi:MAG: hypothetical protein ACSLFQ_05395, partial [Thermoanaerobaculia bacterium]